MDNFIDPGTNSPVPANDVNLFIIIIPYFTSRNVSHDFNHVEEKIKFIDKDRLKAGMTVYLGAFTKNLKTK